MLLERIDKVKEEIIVGKSYLVPCFTRHYNRYKYYSWKTRGFINKTNITVIYPIINYIHNDKENGQPIPHYHVDYRFIELYDEIHQQSVKHLHRNHVFAPYSRINLDYIQNDSYTLNYFALKCIREKQLFSTNISLIANSKLKHSCIYKGKCPHRGYDLSNEPIVNGIITCPLHGLKFNAITGEIIKNV